MSDAKHTPNPLPCGCAAALRRETLTVPAHWHVRQCPLHAAAGEMLAALKSLRAAVDNSVQRMPSSLAAAFKSAGAAIAKAKGVTP